MNDEPDPTEIKAKIDTGSMGRRFAINGQPLHPFSFTHRIAFYRIKQGDVSQLESDALFLFVLTKTAAELDLVRGEKRESEFRLAAGAWAEKQSIPEIMAVAREVNEDMERATSVEPATRPAAGNV